jgi:hypothetical protein
MEEPWGHYAKWEKAATKNTNTMILHEVPKIVKFKHTAEWLLPWEGEMGAYCV